MNTVLNSCINYVFIKDYKKGATSQFIKKYISQKH